MLETYGKAVMADQEVSRPQAQPDLRSFNIVGVLNDLSKPLKSVTGEHLPTITSTLQRNRSDAREVFIELTEPANRRRRLCNITRFVGRFRTGRIEKLLGGTFRKYNLIGCAVQSILHGLPFSRRLGTEEGTVYAVCPTCL